MKKSASSAAIASSSGCVRRAMPAQSMSLSLIRSGPPNESSGERCVAESTAMSCGLLAWALARSLSIGLCHPSPAGGTSVRIPQSAAHPDAPTIATARAPRHRPSASSRRIQATESVFNTPQTSFHPYQNRESGHVVDASRKAFRDRCLAGIAPARRSRACAHAPAS